VSEPFSTQKSRSNENVGSGESAPEPGWQILSLECHHALNLRNASKEPYLRKT